MSDNILIKDGAAANQYLRTTDNAGVHIPHHVEVGFDLIQRNLGKSFQWQYANPTLNGTVNIHLVVPSYSTVDNSPNLRIGLVSGGQADIYLFENPTVTAAGTSSSDIRNKNRNGTYAAPGVDIKTGSTFSADGTELAHHMTLAGIPKEDKDEWVLKPSEDYIVRIVTASSIPVILTLNWNESP